MSGGDSLCMRNLLQPARLIPSGNAPAPRQPRLCVRARRGAARTRHAIACAEPQRAHMAPACARGSGNHCAIRGCWRARPSCRRVGDEMRRVVVNGGALARGDDAAGCLGRGVRAAGQGSARRRRHRRRRGVRATQRPRARGCVIYVLGQPRCRVIGRCRHRVTDSPAPPTDDHFIVEIKKCQNTAVAASSVCVCVSGHVVGDQTTLMTHSSL